jgi:hypothetical protein
MKIQNGSCFGSPGALWTVVVSPFHVANETGPPLPRCTTTSGDIAIWRVLAVSLVAAGEIRPGHRQARSKVREFESIAAIQPNQTPSGRSSEPGVQPEPRDPALLKLSEGSTPTTATLHCGNSSITVDVVVVGAEVAVDVPPVTGLDVEVDGTEVVEVAVADEVVSTVARGSESAAHPATISITVISVPSLRTIHPL